MKGPEFIVKLNSRNKVALCATLTCVGLILLLGGGVRPAVGVSLLGIAFSWALGSNYRLVHWLFILFGVLLLIPAVWEGISWPRRKPELIRNEISIIEDDKEAMRILTSEDLRKEFKQLLEDQQELANLQAEGAFRHVVKYDKEPAIGGLLLLGSGLGLIFGVKPVRRNQQEALR